MGDAWSSIRRIAADVVEVFYARFDPRDAAARCATSQAEDEIAARIDEALEKLTASTRTASCGCSSMPCSRRSVPTVYQVDNDGQPSRRRSPSSSKARKLDRNVAATAALRNLRLFAALRGRAYALRQGGARRHPLVRPAAGLPHRDPGSGEGAAGQERRHRAGRRQRRLRAEADAEERRRATQFMAEGIATYKLFIGTLLDITDNYARGRHGHSAGLRGAPRGRRSYLVVAADKGTATFSDFANGLAIEHGYWLGDAFASGGSVGYDHKVMGITARGAWESVKRHFREMDIDIGVKPFTVVGVGDMSGDVFGNGMLREETTRLLAAFDHRDIFIDPDPGSRRAASPNAQRLFDLPRSSWQDYNKSLISKGGGVYPRSSKEIKLSPEAQSVDRRAGKRDAAGFNEGDPEDAGRPAVLRRHRHLCARVEREPTRRSAIAPTMRSASRAPICGEGGRRGRQSRHDAARAHRGGARWRAAEHRRHRQLRRRQHLRRRGQYQDRAVGAGA